LSGGAGGPLPLYCGWSKPRPAWNLRTTCHSEQELSVFFFLGYIS